MKDAFNSVKTMLMGVVDLLPATEADRNEVKTHIETVLNSDLTSALLQNIPEELKKEFAEIMTTKPSSEVIQTWFHDKGLDENAALAENLVAALQASMENIIDELVLDLDDDALEAIQSYLYEGADHE